MIQNKHIIRLSFIVLFFNIIANIILYRYFMIEEVIVKQISDNNSYLLKIYRSEIWDKNIKKLNQVKGAASNNSNYNKSLIRYAEESIDFFKNIDAGISVFNKEGKKIISNYEFDPEYYNGGHYYSIYNKILQVMDNFFLSDYIFTNPLNQAFKGKTIHSLAFRSIANYDNTPIKKSFIISYMPIISSKNGKFEIEGVVEIINDITEQWNNISLLEKRALVIFIVIFLIFFSVVMYNTNYAQKIINKQFETNRALSEAKNKAETESLAKTEFLANISHELRTPLNAIIGFSEIILSETYGKINNKNYQEYISDINNSGKHLLGVINDILDFSKASADKLPIDNVELDLNKLTSSSIRLIKPRAEEVNINIIENVPDRHLVIIADPKRLKQALLNLLSNAVKFTPAEGYVKVTIAKNILNQTATITIADNGIGMSEEQIPKAMASFGQVDNKLNRKYEGTGLGLPLTKKLIELMNGKFNIESKKGKGTKVTLTFHYDSTIQFE